jgi:predicted ATPase
MARFPARSHVLVGRRKELESLQNARRALAQSRGSLVLVSGEAGMGKSRLVASFLRASGEGRLRNVMFAECLENVRHPYGPLRSLLAKIAPSVMPSTYSKRALRALVQLAPGALEPAIVSTYAGTSLDTGELFEALLELVTTIASRRATILCIDDIHWADQSTLAALAYLGPRIAATRLMIVCTFRSEVLDQEPEFYRTIATLSSGPVSQAMNLAPLSSAEMTELIDSATHGMQLQPAAKATIQRHADGNPFYAEELLKGAVDGPPGSPTSMPLSLRAGILHRTAALAADDRQVIARAAVLGYRFTPAMLAAVSDRTVDSLVPMLRRARGANLIIEEASPSKYCRFRHALTRQIIYDDLLASERQLLHNQILKALEALPELDNVYAELAYHAHAAHDGYKTLLYNEKAGEAALAVGAKSEAAGHFEAGLSAAQDDGDRARLLEQLGNVAREESRLHDAIAIFESVLVLRLARAEYVEAARIVILSARSG